MTINEFKCNKCGSIFHSEKTGSAKCQCGFWTTVKKTVCADCGIVFHGGTKTSRCKSCTNKMRIEKLKSGVANCTGLDVPKELLLGIPKDIQHHIKHEYFLHPELAQRIAKEARTAMQAKQMREDYHKARECRGSYGVSEIYD